MKFTESIAQLKNSKIFHVIENRSRDALVVAATTTRLPPTNEVTFNLTYFAP